MTEIYIYSDEKFLKNWSSAHECGLLMTEALKNAGFPYINVTHSERYVAVAGSNCPIGIDCELIERQVKNMPVVKDRVFSEKEKIWVGENEERFVKLWTVKEAYGKMLGKGLLYDCRGTEFTFSGDLVSGPEGAHIMQFLHEGLVITACGWENFDNIHIFTGSDVAKLLHIS